MFGDMVFVQSGIQERHRLQWTRAGSLLLQTVAVSLVFLASLARVEPPPPLTIGARPPEFVRDRVMQIVTRREELPSSAAGLRGPEPAPSRVLTVPRSIPHGIAPETAAPEMPLSLNACAACAGQSANAFASLTESEGGGISVRPTAPTKPIKISHLDPGSLLYRVQPAYPAPAKVARIQGTVLLHAIIARNGTIESLQVVSGPPMLVRSALDAVKQWRYRPYMLNGQPIEVETDIAVHFALGG